VLKSTFLGSEFHTECLVIKMKKKFRPPVPIFYQTATGSTGIFLGLTLCILLFRCNCASFNLIPKYNTVDCAMCARRIGAEG